MQTKALINCVLMLENVSVYQKNKKIMQMQRVTTAKNILTKLWKWSFDYVD